jgi:serine/threonine protein kinase
METESWQQKWIEVKLKLGGGGQGTAVRVIERRPTLRHGVLKTIAKSNQLIQEEREKFIREAEIFSRSSHPGIPRLLDTNCAASEIPKQTDLYFVTEFMGGLALHKQIYSQAYTADEAILFVIRLLDIVEYLHTADIAICHRDIKPQNIIVRGKLDPVLIDFGMSQIDDGRPDITIINPSGTVGNNFLRLTGKSSSKLDISQCFGILLYLLTNSDPGDLSRSESPPHRSPKLHWLSSLEDADKKRLMYLFDTSFAQSEDNRFTDVAEARTYLNDGLTRLKHVSPVTKLLRSSLAAFSGQEMNLDTARFDNLQTQLVETCIELAHAIQLPDNELSSLSVGEILGKSQLVPSECDAEPILQPAQAQDIFSVLEIAANVKEDHLKLKEVLVFYPAILNYLRQRIQHHVESQTKKFLLIAEQERNDALEKYHGTLEQIQKDLGLSELSPQNVEKYQRFLDALNIGFDNEFSAVKEVLYPEVWKFGLCVFETDGVKSFHRVYRVPKGANAPLILSVVKPPTQDWFNNIIQAQKSPIGRWSEFFETRGIHDAFSMRFMNQPEWNAEDFLCDSLKMTIKQRSLPLRGELLCKEHLFYVAARFQKPLGLTVGSTLDLSDFKHRIDRSVEWFSAVIMDMAAAGVPITPQTVTDDFLMSIALSVPVPSIAPKNEEVKILNNQQKPVIETMVRQTPILTIASSSCIELLERGHNIISNPYHDLGMSPVPLIGNFDENKRRENIKIILENTLTEYRQFTEGNGFARIQPRIFDHETVVYFVNPDNWPKSRVISIFETTVMNEDGELPPVIVNFDDQPPQWNVNEISIGSRKYELQGRYCNLSDNTLAKDRPLQSRVYALFEKDAKEIYAPKYY